DRNNARNRCVFTKNKAQGQLVNIDVVFKELKKKEEKDDIIVPVKKTKLLK
ncbi:MAG: hypothetical protein RLY43_130, partial [Bacteroidota bacterium]